MSALSKPLNMKKDKECRSGHKGRTNPFPPFRVYYLIFLLKISLNSVYFVLPTIHVDLRGEKAQRLVTHVH